MESPIVWKHRPIYLGSPELDTMMSVILDLAGQVYVLKDRLTVIETYLEDQQIVSRQQLDAWEPTPEQQAELRRQRDAFVSSVFRALAEAEDTPPA